MQLNDEVRKYDSCIRNNLDLFKNYDSSVDVVSCLETFFNKYYKGKIAYFNRFPRFNEKNPDFSILLKDNTAIIGEVTRSFPNNESGFLKEMEQLKSYDEKVYVTNEKGEKITPKNHDILLILGMYASSEIVGKINDWLRQNTYNKFQNNIIIWEYQSNFNERVPKYNFRHFPSWPISFSSSLHNTDDGLNTILFKNNQIIDVRIEDFMRGKLEIPYINDPPPPSYMCVQLWHQVFYDFLKPKEKFDFGQFGSKNFWIDVTVDELTERINSAFLPIPIMRKSWIKNALNYLMLANLAEKITSNSYRVKFKKLTSESRKQHSLYQGELEHDIFDELGRRIVSLYCKHVTEKGDILKKLDSKRFVQKRLF